MSDKKTIDRLFQEKLKDFEVTPSDSVWDNISTELISTGKGKKGVTMWWYVGGVAAALLLLFTFNQLVLKDNSTTPSQEETIVNSNSKKDSLDNDLQNVIDKENSVAKEKIVSEDIINNSVTNTDTTPAKKDTFFNENTNNDVNTNTKTQKDVSNTLNDNKKELVSPTDQTKNVIVANTTSNLSEEKVQNNNVVNRKADEVLNNDSNFKVKTASVGANLTPYDIDQNFIELLETNIIIKDKKLSLIEEIAASEDENSDDLTEEEFERWKAASVIAPVYFNTFGKGSSIHPQFNNNSKTGDVNMSYGITGSYAFNKKLSVRTGVNKVNLGYSTNDVLVFNNIGVSIEPQLLRSSSSNIEVAESAQNLSFISVEEFNFAQVPSVLSNNIKSSIDQKLGFIEVPVELVYKISDKKMSFNVIGGFSALFLNENGVYSTFEGNTILLGKATNINTTSFSANFGLGFDFKISNKFNLNLEPVFKYQLNTFNDTSGDFKPFFIGVYSGLSFKF